MIWPLQEQQRVLRSLGVDEPVWVPTVFTKNRDRLLEAEVARNFLAELVNHNRDRRPHSRTYLVRASHRVRAKCCSPTSPTIPISSCAIPAGLFFTKTRS